MNFVALKVCDYIKLVHCWERQEKKKKTRTTFQWRKVPPGQQHAKYKYKTISHFGQCTGINTTFKRLVQCVFYTLLKFPSFPLRPSLHISSLNFHFWFPVVSQTREKKHGTHDDCPHTTHTTGRGRTLSGRFRMRRHQAAVQKSETFRITGPDWASCGSFRFDGLVQSAV